MYVRIKVNTTQALRQDVQLHRRVLTTSTFPLQISNLAHKHWKLSNEGAIGERSLIPTRLDSLFFIFIFPGKERDG